MSKSLPKVLLVAHYQKGMGFTRVANHIKKALKGHFEIHHYAFLYKGEPFVDEDNVRIYPGNHDSTDHKSNFQYEEK